MPNWSFNYLSVTGKKEDLQDFLVNGLYGNKPVYAGEKQDAVKIEPTMNKIIPVPTRVLEAGYSAAGYHWQIDNWGTKWDMCNFDDFNDDEEELENLQDHEIFTLNYSYETAWATNEIWVEKASAKFPNLFFEMEFEEESGAYAGRVVYRAGSAILEKNYTDLYLYYLEEGIKMSDEVIHECYDRYYDEDDYEEVLEMVVDALDNCINLGLLTKEKVEKTVYEIYHKSEEEIA